MANSITSSLFAMIRVSLARRLFVARQVSLGGGGNRILGPSFSYIYYSECYAHVNKSTNKKQSRFFPGIVFLFSGNLSSVVSFTRKRVKEMTKVRTENMWCISFSSTKKGRDERQLYMPNST